METDGLNTMARFLNCLLLIKKKDRKESFGTKPWAKSGTRKWGGIPFCRHFKSSSVRDPF